MSILIYRSRSEHMSVSVHTNKMNYKPDVQTFDFLCNTNLSWTLQLVSTFFICSLVCLDHVAVKVMAMTS